MSTEFLPTEASESNRKWHLVDAEGITLGRLATEVATLIRGKHKPNFTRNVDCGDSVIVINAEKVHVTGNKRVDKIYYQHTGYVGNTKAVPLGEMIENRPHRVIEEAVWGMLPKGILGKGSMRKRLKVFAGGEHPHSSQLPEKYEFKFTKVVAK